MNVVTALRADEDIGPYQLLRPQLCDNTLIDKPRLASRADVSVSRQRIRQVRIVAEHLVGRGKRLKRLAITGEKDQQSRIDKRIQYLESLFAIRVQPPAYFR